MKKIKCPKCDCLMILGFVLNYDYSTNHERGIMNVRPAPSDGRLIECYKCPKCGYSEIEDK